MRSLMARVSEILAYGGSRSGKTFEYVRTIVLRALVAPRSNHAIFRYRFNHCKASIVYGTFPAVMQQCFPGATWHLDKSDWFAEFPNGSRIWFGGLDDKERTEKILGQEHATIFLNEISQLAYSSVLMAKTRLAQKAAYVIDGVTKHLRLLMLYDCNPPPRSHWSYKYFFKHEDPESGARLDDSKIGVIQVNPKDNADNLPAEYLEALQKLPPRFRQRFWEGIFADALPGALWTIEGLEKNRVESHPTLIRVVVAVDPSGADDEDEAPNDEIGIMTVGLGDDGDVYVLEDSTVKAGPKTWGAAAVSAYDRHAADRVVAEVNYGGAMVKFVLQAAAKAAKMLISFKMITASRGKHVRAEPVAALDAQGRIHLVGHFPKLEDELCSMTTHGYVGSGSPNRADALVWAISDLFPGLVRKTETDERQTEDRKRAHQVVPASSWFPSARP
jgi:hypothetical protein